MGNNKRWSRRIGNFGLGKIGLGEQTPEISFDSAGNERIRIRRSPVQGVASSLRAGWRAALVRPQRWDKAQYYGVHADGGREAFTRAMREKRVRDQDLPAIAQGWKHQSMVYCAGALCCVAAALWTAAGGGVMNLLYALATLCLAALLSGLSLAMGFRGWRVRQRRMGSLHEYLRTFPVIGVREKQDGTAADGRGAAE